jgi:hypothetical protein
VFYLEGEKDVDRARSVGLLATTNPMGAGKWRDEYAAFFQGRHVVVLPDNDADGAHHAKLVVQGVAHVAASVKVVNLPGLPLKGDLSDWLDAGHTRDELEQLIASTPVVDSRLATMGEPSNENRRSTSGFVLTPLDTLLAEPTELTSYLVDDMLPVAGLSLCAAKPKVGKSTLARNLALAVARGEPFLGRATIAGPVIYLALEEKRAEVKAHFERMGATDELIIVHVGLAPADALHALARVVAEYKPVLAIVDPLLKLVRLSDANDYAEVSRSLEPLIDLARTSGCHIFCTHHLGKADRDGGDAILGSTAIFAAFDTALMMKRRESDRTLRTVQRYGDDLPETVLTLDPEAGRILAGDDLATIQLDNIGREVLAAIGDEELTEAEIRKRVGGDTGLVGKALRRLVDLGHVTRTGGGKKGAPYFYHLAVAPPARHDDHDVAPAGGDAADSRFALLPPMEKRENEHNGHHRVPGGDTASYVGPVTALDARQVVSEPQVGDLVFCRNAAGDRMTRQAVRITSVEERRGYLWYHVEGSSQGWLADEIEPAGNGEEDAIIEAVG